ncbi:hypothetical protein ACF0H5_018828 [Mactra antiquata]
MYHLRLCMFVLTLKAVIDFSQCQMLEDVQRLTDDLLKNCNSLLRPRRNQSEVLIVNLKVELITLLELNEVEETLSLMAIMLMSWKDDQLVWNPRKYNGIQATRLRSEQVWTPPLVLINSVTKIEQIGHDHSWLLVFALSNGLVYFSPGLILSTKCEVDVTYYPWDEHNCKLLFLVWGYYPQEVAINPIENEIGRTYYTENGAWELKGSEIWVFEVSMQIVLRLKRRPEYVLVNAVCPIVFLSFVSTIVFLIPAASGERVSFSLTILLSIVVFFTIIGDSLPKTSKSLSIFSLYLLFIMVTSIFATLANVFSLYIYYKDEQNPVTQCWVKFTRCILCRSKKRPMKSRGQSQHDGKHPNVQDQCIKNNQSCLPYIVASVSNDTGECRYTNSKDSDTSIEDKFDRNENVSWKDVSVAVDRLLFILCFMIVSISTIVFAVLMVK